MSPKPLTNVAKRFLETLQLKPIQSENGLRVPCYSEVRKAYRKLLKQHPDLGGDNASFQEITQAGRELFQYIWENPESVEKEPEVTTDDPDDEDNVKEILEMFESTTDLKYNEKSVTFLVDKDLVTEWKETLESYFSTTATTPKGEPGKLMFRKDDWEVPGREGADKETGTVTVSLWLHPAKGKGKSKMNVQGKLYFPFVTLTLPTLAAAVRKRVTLQITMDDKYEAEKILTNVDDKEEGDKTLEKPKEDNEEKGEESLEKMATKVNEDSKDGHNVTAKKDLVKEKVQDNTKITVEENVVYKDTVTSNEKHSSLVQRPEQTSLMSC